jgi:hypothetical protein
LSRPGLLSSSSGRDFGTRQRYQRFASRIAADGCGRPSITRVSIHQPIVMLGAQVARQMVTGLNVAPVAGARLRVDTWLAALLVCAVSSYQNVAGASHGSLPIRLM